MKAPTAFSVDRAVEAYLPLMHELGIRIDLVAQACVGKLGLSPPYAREYAYLQFRRVCELIALGCLRLHGDLPEAQTQAAKKEWHAEKIMQLLSRRFSHCFPQSLVRTRTERGWELRANAVPGALTYAEFRTLYSECGEVLHRGTIKSLEASPAIDNRAYERVLQWQQKLVALMNEHVVARANGSGLFHISIRSPNGYPECSVLNFNGDGTLSVDNKKLNVVPAGSSDTDPPFPKAPAYFLR